MSAIEDEVARLSAIEDEVARLSAVEAAHAAELERLQGVEAELAAAGDALRRAEQIAAERSREVELVRASTSWRLTSPLRAVADFVTGRPPERRRDGS